MTVTLHDFDGEYSLTCAAGGLPADAAVVAAGHEPSGYFWEGLVQFGWPELAERLDFDSESGMFCARGKLSDLTELKATLEFVLSSPREVRQLIARAETAGFEFDD
ncbi:Imm51 family immunity protein [Streptomyces sp. GXMU-J15]|uniref:Imm51 family immunity protein n=1 Tax=Streptomyces fuscus TaxID=3048495 RepID=A0ABT7J2F4_9ACTN|nr:MULTISPECIES: Imm51 family immunity protein [Streptomyces]MDL2079043.1 Imm51 family immunity protein [Streptomyces fuscus]SBT94713.1 Immunity protein 51 [Streptomyces sp. DI166]